jgi:hypothetical protein
MSLLDKFGIIENHIKDEIDNKDKIIRKIENYFENYLNTDVKVLLSDYINQVIWFENINKNDLIININSYIKNFLIQRRNTMRTYIKKDSFELSNLNTFLKTFIDKLEYINNIIKSTDKIIIKDGIDQLINLIISDSFILLFIEEQVLSFDQKTCKSIKKLFKFTKKIQIYDDLETFNKLTKTLGNIFKKNLVDSEELPLPENIKKIQKLCNSIDHCIKIRKYYEFIGTDINKITSSILQIILNDINPILFNEKITNEKKIYEYLKTKFGLKVTYKIEKIIIDTETSFYDNILFNKNNTSNIIVMTTSYNNWNINQSEGVIDFPLDNTLLGSYINKYTGFYKENYSNKRILNWFLHFGEINITYLNKQFIMLPIQFMILEHFDNIETHSIDNIIQLQFLKNYTLKFKKEIIASLIIGGLLKNNSNMLSLNKNTKKMEANLISVFLTNSDYTHIWEQSRDNELIHTREEIISTNINHVLKQKEMNKNDLIKKIKQTITLFEVSDELFNKTFNRMIDMDYIKEEHDMCYKLVY